MICNTFKHIFEHICNRSAGLAVLDVDVRVVLHGEECVVRHHVAVVQLDDSSSSLLVSDVAVAPLVSRIDRSWWWRRTTLGVPCGRRAIVAVVVALILHLNCGIRRLALVLDHAAS